MNARVSSLVATIITGLLVLMDTGSHAYAEDTIRIGVISAKSGDFAMFGQSGEKGVVLATEEINAAGGILGRQIELMLADDKSKADEASRIYREQVANGAELVIGNIGSAESAAVSALAKEDKIPFLTTLGAASFLTEQAGHRYFFRLVTNSRIYFEPVAELMAKEAHTRYCAISNDYAFGHDYHNGFMAAIKQRKPEVALVNGCEFWVPLGTTDFAPFITAIQAKQPEVLSFGGLEGHGAQAFLQQAQRFGLLRRMVGLHTSLGFPGNNAGIPREALSENILTGSDYPYPPVDRPANKAFFDAYRARWDELPLSANSYATMHFVGEAFTKAGKVDAEAFVEAAEGLTVDHPAAGPIQMRSFDHQGTMGLFVGELIWDEQYDRVGMKDIRYISADSYLPTMDEIKALRAQAKGD